MARQERYVVGLDIGTTKVCALIVEPGETLGIIGDDNYTSLEVTATARDAGQ